MAELPLHPDAAFWHAYVSGIPDTILIINHEERVCFINRTDAASQQIIGQPLASYVGDEQLKPLREAMTKGDSGDLPRLYITTVPQQDGNQVVYEYHLSRSSLEGQPYWVILARDITERIKAERELQTQHIILSQAQAVAKFGVWYSDPSLAGKLNWSDEVYAIFGVSKDSFDGKVETFFRLVHPDDRAMVEEASTKALADPAATYQLVHRIVRPDGRVRWVEEYGKVIWKEGKPTSFLGVCHDVTEQHEIQEKLEKERTYFHTLIQHSYELVHVVDESNRIGFASPSVERILGYRVDEFTGQESASFIHPDDLELAQKTFESVLSTPATPSKSIILRIKKKSGEYIFMEVVGINLLHIPEVASVVVHSRDISDRKRYEDELVARNKELENTISLMTDRELKMIELKQTIKELEQRLSAGGSGTKA